MENFLALGLPWPKGMQVASIGPITSQTARDHGLTIDIEAQRHDIDGLVDAISEFFAEKSERAKVKSQYRNGFTPPNLFQLSNILTFNTVQFTD